MERDRALKALREEAKGCTRCPLHLIGSQVVFGEGPPDAQAVLVGEQPGDQEDQQDRPFVGPAGQLLDRALMEAGIDRASVYVTNAVKHFKFVQRGKRRLHQKPDSGEIEACRIWITRELELTRPRLVVAMGATAAQSLLGKTVTISRERGRFRPWGEAQLLITAHPSFILRIPDRAAKAQEYERLVADLRVVSEAVQGRIAEPAQAALL
jgi:DNA polymerase